MRINLATRVFAPRVVVVMGLMTIRKKKSDSSQSGIFALQLTIRR